VVIGLISRIVQRNKIPKMTLREDQHCAAPAFQEMP